jgi:ADP-ribosylglycohydrolase
MSPNSKDRLIGLLLGTAVGDALGLPAEGLSRARIERRWRGVWRHRFLFGRGMCSDDTEHTLFAAQALLAHPTDAQAFQRCLAGKFRLWLLGLPAGIGLATLRSTLKLWLGCSPKRSGVFSAGNGPAMRSAVIGAFFADNRAKLREFVSASTRITHTDPKAETAALAIAEAAAWRMLQNKPLREFVESLPRLSQESEWQALCHKMSESLASELSVHAFADRLGLAKGITGYAYHTVPVALYAWARHQGDFRGAMESALSCGGDTDTVGAILGALAGADGGKQGIPQAWLCGICDWPRSPRLLELVGERLARQITSDKPLGPVAYFWPAVVPRNILFLWTVIIHGFARLVFWRPEPRS